MRSTPIVLLLVSMCGLLASGSVAAQTTDSSTVPKRVVQIEIQSPSIDFTAVQGETTVEVEGIASAIGGVRYLDMMFVMDTSQSLRSTDPTDFRSAGAVGLVRNLSPRSDIKIGVVSFDSKGQLVQPMTSERDSVVEALQKLPRSGNTNLAAGLLTALKELEEKEAQELIAGSPRELARCLQSMEVLKLAEMWTHAALTRKASCRFLTISKLEYPDNDPPEWHKFITIKKGQDTVEVGDRPLYYWNKQPYALTYKENYERHKPWGKK